MKAYTTLLKAIDPTDGILKTYSGDLIFADSFEEAEEKCQKIGKGYLQVHGELVGIIKYDCFVA